MKLETLKTKIKEKEYPKIGDVFFDINKNTHYAVWVIESFSKNKLTQNEQFHTKLIYKCSGDTRWNHTFSPDIDNYLTNERLKFIGNIKDYPEFML